MKIKIKSVLKTASNHFECFDQNHVLFQAGKALCIKQLAKNTSTFITLHHDLQHLFCFRSSANQKAVLSAELFKNRIDIAMYNLKSQRVAINVSETNIFLLADNVEKMQLVVDEFDNSLVYGAAWSKQDSTCVCIFLADFSKSKVMAVGFVPVFEDIKINSSESLGLSICGFNGNCNYVKTVKYNAGLWEIQEQLLKKMQSGPAYQHDLLFGNRMVVSNNNRIFVFQDLEVIQTINATEQQAAIVEMMKLPKGLLVRLSNDSVKAWSEDSDQRTFIPFGNISLALSHNSHVTKIQLSSNNEEVILRTNHHQFFVWKCDELHLPPHQRSQSRFTQLQNSPIVQVQGTLSIATQQKYCLLAGLKTVSLCNLETNQNMLSVQFSNLNEQNKKMIFCSAINPDGNSFLLGFEDKVKVYKILLSKFKQIAEFSIKRCQSIIFSHGGQLAACRFGKGQNSSISILNIIRMMEICVLKIHASPLQIVWNELDDELFVSTENQTIQTYKISDSSRLWTIKLEKPINYIRLDYKTKRLLASTDSSVQVISQGSICESVGNEINDFHYIYPLYGIYLAVTKNGNLLWSNTMKLEGCSTIPLFMGSFGLACRNGYLVAFRSFSEITVLQCNRLNYASKKNGCEDIVLIERDEIKNLFSKVDVLEKKVELLNESTMVKLEDEKKRYDEAIHAEKQSFSREISFLNEKYSDCAYEKLKQQKETEKFFEELEDGQVRNVYELEKMYDRKLKLEKDKFMTLEQSFLEQKLKYEQVILNLEDKYSRDVALIREEYFRKSQQENKVVDEVRKKNLEYKKKMEMKMIDLEEENEVTFAHFQETKDEVIHNLKLKISQIEEDSDRMLVQFQNQKLAKEKMDSHQESHIRESKKLHEELKEFENRVKLLRAEIEKKNSLIDDKNNVIAQQNHQIADLEKAKYVLSFRTTEIRKELEPKESLIEKLRSQLSKLEDEYKNQEKSIFELERKIEKLEKISVLAGKENEELKVGLRSKEKTHDQLCFEVFMIINTVDPKDWNASFVKIYQSYIKEDKFKSRQVKKKDATSEEINRHLIHVEQTLLQLTNGNDKILKGKDKDVVRKMKENAELVYDLNIMRKKENDYLHSIQQKSNQILRLRRELTETNKTSTTRAHTANTGLTRRVINSRDNFSRQKSHFLDVNDLDFSSKKQMNGKIIHKDKSRIASAHKTLMFREEKREKNGKVFELARELESSRGTIKRQDKMIEELNQRLLGLVEDQF